LARAPFSFRKVVRWVNHARSRSVAEVNLGKPSKGPPFLRGGLVVGWYVSNVIDANVATFTYGGGYLSKVEEPGSRTVTVTHNSGDLTVFQNADASLRTFTCSTQTSVRRAVRKSLAIRASTSVRPRARWR